VAVGFFSRLSPCGIRFGLTRKVSADDVKTALDVAGLLPVVGDAANAASAGISLVQGNYGEAALSAVAAIPLIGSLGEVAKGAKLADEGVAAARAVELAEKMGKTKDFVTIAVTETKEGVNIVSSSENALRAAVRAALKEGEVAAKGAGHAEVTGVNAAKQMGLTPTGVAASRGICPSCAQFLRDVGVAALNGLRGISF